MIRYLASGELNYLVERCNMLVLQVPYLKILQPYYWMKQHWGSIQKLNIKFKIA